MSGPDLERLIQLIGKLPGLGPRSARRVALAMLKKRETLMQPLGEAILSAVDAIQDCSVCGNLDTVEPCSICADKGRDPTLICVVEDVGDLWAVERSGAFRGRYHVLGGTLSALDGVGPDDLRIAQLVARAQIPELREIILAMGATVEGQATAHYVTDRLHGTGVDVSRLGHGVPIGGELDYLDDGTLTAALKSRKALS